MYILGDLGRPGPISGTVARTQEGRRYRHSGLRELPSLPRVSCRRKADGFESLFQKFLKVGVLKLRGQSDLMADVSVSAALCISRWKMAENRPGDRDATAAAAAVQIPHELPSIYWWVANDVLGAPSILDQRYLDELKATRVLFGGGGLEQRYRVEAARRGERVYYLNLDHPTVPHWLWVNEVMFTDFGMRVPFTDFQQRLLNRASVTPSQLHPNAWSSIRCFELVTEFLQLPQEPEVFLCLFKFYSSNTSGRTKKGYMSVRPTKHRKIFTLYEDSFHDFKGRYFKIFAVGDHRPFWLSLEGDGLFPPYWSDQAGFDIALVKYDGLNVDKRDTADILTFLFSKNNLSSKSLLNSPKESRKAIAKMAGNDVTLARLRRLVRPAPAKLLPSSSAVPASAARVVLVESVGKTQAEPDGGSSTNVGNVGVGDQYVEVSSPTGEEIPLPPPPSPKKHRSAVEGLSDPKRVRTLEGGSRDFCLLDRSFDAPGFIESHLLGPRAQEILRDCDPLESIRWAEWAMIRAATIMKSVEPRLTIAEEAERLNTKLLGDAKTLNLQKMVLEEEKADAKADAIRAKLKLEEDLKALKAKLVTSEKEKGAEIDRLRRREEGFLAKVEKFRGLAAEEKVRANLVKASVADLHRQCEDLAEDAKGVVAATEGALKAQLAILLPDFNTNQISFFKDIVDGKVVDPAE
ncbi:hypothetical protein PIB30_052290 [Stylosanthes scabra]|uniref:Transposase (putative) gypsy type domain-containing protein n=1 Tax=Stylosanthes scabra TaxID=79078 RepID=A0ABU6QJX8_9FABA|nr:hypothetical protein [Stylosanthes scabra]